MDTHKDIRTDKTIVIGFTGPIGSGCTTLSKFLSEELNEDEEYKGVVNYLEKNDYVDTHRKNKINQMFFDKELKDCFKNIEAITDAEIDEKKQKQLEKLHQNVKKILEKREYTYSLEYLFDNEFYKNRLRISCSSIILFIVLTELAKNKKPVKDHVGDDKFEKVNRFINSIEHLIEKYDVDLKHLQNTYALVSSLFHHEEEDSFEKDEESRYKSDDTDKCFDYVHKVKKDLLKEIDYREIMQDFGDNIRATGEPFLYPDSQWINENKDRFKNSNVLLARIIDYIIHFYVRSDKKINLFLIDSFRNPKCIEYLRKRYPRFYLISLFAAFPTRKGRLQAKFNIPEGEVEKRLQEADKRDKGDLSEKRPYEQLFKQNVDETVQIADIAINNDLINSNKVLFEKTLRYLSLIFDPGCTKPTTDEMFMNMAYSMAMKSNCISRQVGAVIAGKEGYVVGAGWNDVGAGQISCGLRNIKDLSLSQYGPLVEAFAQKSEDKSLDKEEIIDRLKIKYGKENYCFCFKDDISKLIIDKKIVNAYEDINYSDGKQDIVEHFKDNLHVATLQYCKALHAEENAIIQASKIGGMGLKGGRIYTTTFPCELCAKKIQQVGLEEVIYVEPYPDNISEKIYFQDGVLKVKTRQFEGVKGYAYFKLFKPLMAEKDWQRLENSGFVA